MSYRSNRHNKFYYDDDDRPAHILHMDTESRGLGWANNGTGGGLSMLCLTEQADGLGVLGRMQNG